MANLESVANAGSGFQSIIGGLEGIFGSSQSTSGSTSQQSETTASLTGENRSKLEIEDEAIAKIVSDLFSGREGLASIFAGESNAGIFDSSVANLAAGDLVAQIVGEISKLRAERVETQDQTQTQSTTAESTTKQEAESGGLLDSIF